MITQDDLNRFRYETAEFVKKEIHDGVKKEFRELMQDHMDMKLAAFMDPEVLKSQTHVQNPFAELLFKLQDLKSAGLLITASGIIYINDLDTSEMARQAITNMEKKLRGETIMAAKIGRPQPIVTPHTIDAVMQGIAAGTIKPTFTPDGNMIDAITGMSLSDVVNDPNNNGWSSYGDNRLETTREKLDRTRQEVQDEMNKRARRERISSLLKEEEDKKKEPAAVAAPATKIYTKILRQSLKSSTASVDQKHNLMMEFIEHKEELLKDKDKLYELFVKYLDKGHGDTCFREFQKLRSD